MEQAPSAVSWLFRIAAQSAVRYADRPRLRWVVCQTWVQVPLRERRRDPTVVRSTKLRREADQTWEQYRFGNDGVSRQMVRSAIA